MPVSLRMKPGIGVEGRTRLLQAWVSRMPS